MVSGIHLPITSTDGVDAKIRISAKYLSMQTTSRCYQCQYPMLPIACSGITHSCDFVYSDYCRQSIPKSCGTRYIFLRPVIFIAHNVLSRHLHITVLTICIHQTILVYIKSSNPSRIGFYLSRKLVLFAYGIKFEHDFIVHQGEYTCAFFTGRLVCQTILSLRYSRQQYIPVRINSLGAGKHLGSNDILFA